MLNYQYSSDNQMTKSISDETNVQKHHWSKMNNSKKLSRDTICKHLSLIPKSILPSRKTIEVKPELIIKTRETSFFVIGFLNSLKNFTIHLEFHTMLSRVFFRYRSHDGSASATLLRLFFDRHRKNRIHARRWIRIEKQQQ